jgi:NAD-dependent deacetylase
MEDSFERLVAELRHRERTVWLTGAGISVASGIPPYRGSSDAVWSRYLTEWGTYAKFRADPALWWREFWLGAHAKLSDTAVRPAPNPAHIALASLVRERLGDAIVTQNVDGLHRASGAPEDRLIEIHGRGDRFGCTSQRCPAARALVDSVDLSGLDRGAFPRCARCRAPMRPIALLFDEEYASHPLFRWDDARRRITQADAIVFVGTSFAVGITDFALRAGIDGGKLVASINTGASHHLGVDDASAARILDVLGRAEEILPRLATASTSSAFG